MGGVTCEAGVARFLCPQVLHFKLHNDEWREASSEKQVGVPDRCRKR